MATASMSTDSKLNAQAETNKEVDFAYAVNAPEALDHDGLMNERKIVRRIDYRLIPPLTILYLLSFLDRSNLGNAVIFGLSADLGLVGTQFNTALAIFYACYVIVEAPSNILLKRSRASVYLTCIMVGTAIICTCMGFVRNFAGLTAVRALLGLVEGGFFPGVMFVVSTWYKRDEAALRGAILYAAASASGAFGGLLARAIQLMDGVGGYEGWRWIFILEGLLTLVVSLSLYPFIPDSPSTAKWLSNEQKSYVIGRLAEDQKRMPTDFKWAYVRQAVTSPLVWLMMFIEFGSLIGSYAITTFAPSIVVAMGFSAGTAQLLTAPPFVLGCVCTVLMGYLSDRYRMRYPFIMISGLVAVAGTSTLLATNNVPAYTATCLACMGVMPLIPLEITWNGNNQGGSLKRGVAIAMQIGMANTGGIVASYSYVARDAPRYKTGHAVLTGFICLTLIVSTIAAAYIRYENARRDRLYGTDLLSRLSEEEIEQEKELGDKARWWRYTL